jgi:type 1 fimbria pilin
MRKKLLIAVSLILLWSGASFAADKKQDYITNVRIQATKFVDAYNELQKAQLEWNALDYSNTLPNGEGQNLGITKSEVGAVVFDTTDAIETLLGQGHATNLFRIYGEGPDQ